MSCVQYLSGANDMGALSHLTQRPIMCISLFCWDEFREKNNVLILKLCFHFWDSIICVILLLLFCAVILSHASLRLRNMKNRLENKIESAGLKKTPMGIILDLLDQQEEKINKIQDFLESKLKEWKYSFVPRVTFSISLCKVIFFPHLSWC